MTKRYKKEHVINWFFGNCCAKCGKIDSESENYGRKCYEKMKEIGKCIDANEITHKEFVNIMRNRYFCHPSTRKFDECKLCKKFGISNRYWIRNWKGWNLQLNKNNNFKKE